MFEMTTDQLNEIGGFNTTTEIKPQPELWLDTLNSSPSCGLTP